MARLLSVNVGVPHDITWNGKTVRTAIWKFPVENSNAELFGSLPSLRRHSAVLNTSLAAVVVARARQWRTSVRNSSSTSQNNPIPFLKTRVSRVI